MDRIQKLLDNQIELSKSVNQQLDTLHAGYRDLLKTVESYQEAERLHQITNAVNIDLRVINARLQAEIQTQQAEIIKLEIENERLHSLVASSQPLN